MESIVYISTPSEISLQHNANAIRTGLLISTSTFAVGCAYIGIHFDSLSKEIDRNLVQKILFLKNSGGLDKSDFDPDQLIIEVKRLWNLRRDTNALKRYKYHEHHINAIYNAFNNVLIEGTRSYSLMQLAPLRNSDELCVLGFNDANGEQYERDFRISKMLTLKLDPDGTPGPFAFILIDKLAKLSPQDEAGLTPLFTLPNINLLTLDQLIAARKSVRHQVEKLQKLLIPNEATIGQYGGGSWNQTMLAETGEGIQHAIDTNPDLKWAASIQPQFKSKILVGEMDTHRFWQLQRDCNQVPDDSWEALQKLPVETPYPRTIPIIVIRVSAGIAEEAFDKELDSLQHKRKTISLD